MKKQNQKKITSFDLVKTQPQSFERFQEKFLCKIRETSPTQSQIDITPLRYDEIQNNLLSLSKENLQKLRVSSSLSKLPLENAEKTHIEMNLPDEISEKVNDNVIKNSNNTSEFYNRTENSGEIDANFFQRRRKVNNSPKGNFVDVMNFHDKELKIYNNNLLEVHMRKEDSTVIPYVKKFISKLKNVSSLRNIGQLKKSNFLLLSDSSYFHEEVKRNQKLLESRGLRRMFLNVKNFYSSQKYKFKKGFYFKILKNSIVEYKIILHPYQNIKIFWDILHLLLIITWFFYIPMVMAFEEAELTLSFYSSIFLVIDIFLNFNTSYFKNGVVEKNRAKIFANYMKNQLLCDFITFLPIFFDFLRDYLDINHFKTENTMQIIKFVFFLKINTFREISNRILEKFMLREKFQNILSLFKILFISILVVHLFACFWYLTACKAKSFQSNWLSKANLLESPWNIRYLYSMYWASITMMTVGYGDIVPQNELETIVCMISVMLGCAVYAYNINSIGMILQDLNKEDDKFNHNINIINQYMNRKTINQDLQMRVREYLRFIWKEENTQNLEEEQKIIESLSGNLKEELFIDAYGTILKKFPMFFANFTEKTLRKVVSIIKDIKLFPEERVFLEDEDDNLSIYFIMKGKVELFTNSLTIKQLGVGEPFGEISFFSGKSRGLSARSKDFTTLFYINREEFINVLKKNPDDYEKFCMIQDQILLYGNYFPLKIRCFSCNQIGHLANDCQLIHFLPDKEKIIKAHNYYLDQERDDTFSRRKLKKNDALGNKTVLQAASRKIRTKMQKEKDDVRRLIGKEEFGSMNSSEQLFTDLDDEFEDDLLQSNQEYGNRDHTSLTNTDKNNEVKIYEEVSKEKNMEKDSQTNSSNDLVGSSIKSLEQYNVNIQRINSNNLNNETNGFEECKLGTKDEISMKIPEKLGLQNKYNMNFMQENEKYEMIKVKRRFGTEVIQGKKPESSKNIKIESQRHIRKNNRILSYLENNQFFEAYKANPSSFSLITEEIGRINKEEDTEKKTTIISSNFNRNNKPKKFSLLQRNSTIIVNSDKLMDYFETVANFKNYFPENNSKLIFEEINKKQPLRKYSKLAKERKKSLDQRISKYTFFLEDMKEKMPSAIKKKAMRVKKNKREMFMIGVKSMVKSKFQKNWSEMQNEWEKKSFFTDRQINTENKFSDLVKLIMGSPTLKKQLKKNLKPEQNKI